MNNQQKATAAKKAIKSAGGIEKTAAKLSELMNEEVGYHRVQKWTSTGIPPYFCIPMAELSGLPLYEINSTLYPKHLFSEGKQAPTLKAS